MKIVKFCNDKFGIRKFWFFEWNYVDLKNPRFVWVAGSPHFSDCMNDFETVKEVYCMLTGKHVTVKVRYLVN
jgi:hypothetical protein